MYTELHAHTCFSLLDGASTPEAMVERARELGYPSLALTDHDDLGGAVRFAEAAREAGIGGILGVELTVEWSGALTHLTLLAESREGYGHLCQLVTRGRMDQARGRPRVSLDVLAAHAGGLFALTGCPRGRVPSLIAAGDDDGACEAAAVLSDIFDRRVALECWDHGLAEERMAVPVLQRIARALSLPWVVTNDAHYARPEGCRTHDVLTALRHQQTLATMGSRFRPSGEWYLKHASQLIRRWRHDLAGFRATQVIAERCAFRLEDLRPALPDFPLPPGVTADEYLARLVAQGARERWGRNITDAHRRQLSHELGVIAKLGFAGYFLIVWDIVRYARREGILCQGRGSAANSAICYCLGITAIDPVRMELLFERFLSEERREAPDIDLDFAHQERERVIQYVYQRYGREHAAMVCEQISWRGRSAVRDAARVLGLSQEQADELADVADRDSARETAEVLERGFASGAAPAGERENGMNGTDQPPSRRAVEPSVLPSILSGLHQLPRHRSIHVGGFVLTREPLATVVPIEPAAMADRTVIQWEKDDLDPVGLVKIDLLGLGMLTALQECFKAIRRMRGVSLELATIPHGDMAVYDDLCRADTVGVFQVESRAQMNTLPRLKPRNFYDLVVEVALIRPGPIQGDMVHPYLRRRAGTEEVTYPHPSLEPILKRTLGVPLFQEQGMQVAVTAAGFTPGEADNLRRAMGHKRSRERMAAICEKLVEGMRRNGIPEETGRRIFHQINAFADYGFPESHAASFAILVYASAYLRHYYPAEYLAAMLNAQPMGFYSPGTLVEDGRHHGVEVRPVNLMRSAWDTTLEARAQDGPAVRLGIRTVRGLGGATAGRLDGWTAGRSDGSVEWPVNEPYRFRSVADVVATGLDRASLRALASAGAFDEMFRHEPVSRRRRAALWAVLAEERGEAGPLAPAAPAPEPVHIPAMRPVEITAEDYRMTGLSLNGHPMRHLRESVQRLGVRSAAEVQELARRNVRRKEVVVGGLVICRQRPSTAKGFVFVTLEDETGMINVVIPPKLFARQALMIAREPLLLFQGELEVEGLVINVKARACRALTTSGGAEHARSHDFH